MPALVISPLLTSSRIDAVIADTPGSGTISWSGSA